MKNYFALLFLVTSCGPKVGANFTIHNDLAHQIDSAFISTSNKESVKKIDRIAANSKTDVFLDMKNISQGEGSYLLTIYQRGNVRIEPFGYYENRTPFEKNTDILLQPDTILFEPHFFLNY